MLEMYVAQKVYGCVVRISSGPARANGTNDFERWLILVHLVSMFNERIIPIYLCLASRALVYIFKQFFLLLVELFVQLFKIVARLEKSRMAW